MSYARVGLPEQDLAVFPFSFIHFREKVLFEHLKTSETGPFIEHAKAPGQNGHQYEDEENHGPGMKAERFYRFPNIGVAGLPVNPECPAWVQILL